MSASGGILTAVAGLTVGGSLKMPVRSVAANNVMTVNDFAIRGTGGAADITVSLPAAPPVGMLAAVKKVDAGVGRVLVSGNGATIDGAATQPLTNQLDGILVQFAGPNWFTVAEISAAIL